MVEGSPSMWDKLVVSHHKIKKFRNNKATFPLFDDLGELYDGHLAEGNHNFVSLASPRAEDLLHPVHDLENEDDGQGYNDIMEHDMEDEVTKVHRLEENGSEVGSERNGQQKEDEEKDPATNERSRKRRGVAAASRNEEREEKRPRKGSNIEGMMERYLEMRTKQVNDEAAQLAKEKEVVQGTDFSIKKCISVLSTMELTKEEKAKSYSVLHQEQRKQRGFLCACDFDPEAAMIWLRNEMA